jgi:hypothetical protein
MSMDRSINRRAFMAGSGMTIASLAGITLPITLPSAAQSIAVTGQPVADWSVDDMWTGHPRPSQPIAYGRVGVNSAPGRLAIAQPGSIDVLFG